MDRVVILIPAAGSSSRMGGRDKLSENIDGRPLLLRSTERALATGCRVIVTSSLAHPGRTRLLAGISHPNLICAPPVDAREGLSVSIRQGVRLARNLHPAPAGLMILLADLPDLTTDDLQRMLAAFAAAPDRVHRATAADGTPGHPVIIPERLFAGLTRLRADQGAREMLAGEDVRLVALPATHATTDLDTPEAWRAWRDQAGSR